MDQLSIISSEVARKVLTWDLAIEAIRVAFESSANGDTKLFPVQMMHGTSESELFAIKAGVDRVEPLVGFKFGGYWPGNLQIGLPAHNSTTVLLDPRTGFPRALISGSYLNLLRTAAADALAVDTLSRRDASVLGVIGGGHQAEYEIRAIAQVRELSRIQIFTRSRERGRWIINQLSDLDIDIGLAATIEEAIREADIIATVTPATAPLVESAWVRDGAHISAMGADVAGKQELSTTLVARSKLFADHPQQSVTIGEFQHVLREGLIETPDAICPIGLVTQGKATGRTSDSEVTIFDSSGIAIQDLAIANAVVKAANDLGLTASVEF